VRHTDGTRVELNPAGYSVTIKDMPGYEGCEFVVGFVPDQPVLNGLYVRITDEALADVSLTPTFLRRLPYDRLLKMASEEKIKALGESVAPEAAGRPYGGGETHTRAVARVYQWAVTNNMPPRRAIAARWGKSEGTAGRWIAEARKLGLLPPAGKGK
jgi:hypothetical protein